VTFAGMSKNPPSLIAPRIQAIVDAPPPPKEAVAAGNQRRISDKVRRALQLLATGKCKQITDAAAEVGMARESLTRALDRPHVIDYGNGERMSVGQQGVASGC
jgi:hypothetical protein